jgi:hypothetical protein
VELLLGALLCTRMRASFLVRELGAGAGAGDEVACAAGEEGGAGVVGVAVGFGGCFTFSSPSSSITAEVRNELTGVEFTSRGDYFGKLRLGRFTHVPDAQGQGDAFEYSPRSKLVPHKIQRS